MASELIQGISAISGGAIQVPTIPVSIIAGQSGTRIGTTSGLDNKSALNVYIVSGSSVGIGSGVAVSVSGDIVLVVSGGTIQVSGRVVVVSASGNVITDYSGSINVNISGGSVGTTLAGFQSGTLVALSGGGAGISGVAVSVSGNAVSVVSGATIPISIVSGSVGALSGLTGVSISGSVTVVTSGAPAGLVIAASGGTALGLVGGIPADGSSSFNVNSLVTTSLMVAFDGGGASTGQKIRHIQGTSGGALGVLGVQTVGYSYNNVTGAAGITNIKSGACFLHAVNINQFAGSGAQVQIRDSSSGIAGNILGTLVGGSGSNGVYMLYDALLTSGLVTSTSGASPTWDLTVTWRTATS